MTENGSGPADQFYRDVRFRYMCAGGAQLDSPGGWVSGRYERRWNSTLAQARRTIALGGQFILLPHDLWGASSRRPPPRPTPPAFNAERRAD